MTQLVYQLLLGGGGQWETLAEDGVGGKLEYFFIASCFGPCFWQWPNCSLYRSIPPYGSGFQETLVTLLLCPIFPCAYHQHTQIGGRHSSEYPRISNLWPRCQGPPWQWQSLWAGSSLFPAQLLPRGSMSGPVLGQCLENVTNAWFLPFRLSWTSGSNAQHIECICWKERKGRREEGPCV